MKNLERQPRVVEAAPAGRAKAGELRRANG
jgi:hypothetical protein